MGAESVGGIISSITLRGFQASKSFQTKCNAPEPSDVESVTSDLVEV